MYTEIDGSTVFFSIGNGSMSPEQPSVVFLHGAGMDHSIWVLPARHFARHGYNVVALDCPGHGRSGGDAIATIEGMADWVHRVLEHLQIGNAAMVGHSMGSLVALNFAAKYPDSTRALVLLGTSTPMPVTDQLLDAARANEHDAIDMANTWSHSNFGQVGGNENPGICMTMSGQRLLESAGDDVFFTDLSACNNFTNGQDLAEQIRVPTLVLIGRQDKMTSPVSAQQVADIIDDSRVVTLEPCGHAMLSEQPNAVLDALRTIV